MAKRPLSRDDTVLVTHPKFGEKRVRRERLSSLTGAWKRAQSSPRKPAPPKTDEGVTDNAGQSGPDSSTKES